MARMSSWASTGGIVALVIADAALVLLAILHVTGYAGGSSTDAPRLGKVPDSSVGPGQGQGQGRPNNPASSPLETGPVLLDAAADGTILRAGRGSCGDDASGPPPVIDMSTDGGATVDPVDLGRPVGDVLRVSAGGANDLFLVGADPAACALAIYNSTDGGESWLPSPGTAGAWHIASVGTRRVHTPGGSAPVGCDVLALSAYSESGARVLCTDGELRGTASGGTSWVGLGSLQGAVDIGYETPADGWAIATTRDCPAAVLRTADGGVDWEETACLDAEGEPQALSVAGRLIVVQVGGELLTSSDDGVTFAQP
ncbi:MAG: hypothetical protein M3353_04620 [Actinomycetota bacterium]|nr:hypothetical protein [Actinomycetota bacterium]